VTRFSIYWWQSSGNNEKST